LRLIKADDDHRVLNATKQANLKPIGNGTLF